MKLYDVVNLTEPAIAVAAPVKRGLGEGQTLSKVAIIYNSTKHQNYMMNTSMHTMKYTQLCVVIWLSHKIMLKQSLFPSSSSSPSCIPFHDS
jgi:hypothetical protein